MERPIVACSGEVVKDLVALVGPNAGVGAEPAGVLSLGCSMIVAPLLGSEFAGARDTNRAKRLSSISQKSREAGRLRKMVSGGKSRVISSSPVMEAWLWGKRKHAWNCATQHLVFPNLSPKSDTSELRAQSHRASHNLGHRPDMKPHRASTRSNSIDLPRRRRSAASILRKIWRQGASDSTRWDKD
jgi:hypothetical protein